ncbi:hypothetical protein FFI94_032670 [Rhodococcus sp. KBS0724]|uniref:hypothetical protein n=1 Tax=Rhodococcus sp. KBS0724 TaxID=1179674 RepID=UPI00110F15B6|nr:hypothetical protein [Rhodococcus sp. KBS0724]TSD40455.1 hypothetical protein FFI94_032670 [Rhodococcus sp. KBS0724]
MTTQTYASPLVESMISTAARSILDEIGIDSPTESESAEVRQLAETIVRETVDALAGPRRLSGGMRESLLDVADLVTTDPETASVDQIHDVANALRGLLDLHIPARADRQ